MAVPPKPRNHMRKIIIEKNMVKYMPQIDMSDRDKHIVEEYVSGTSYKVLGEKYGISVQRIAQILHIYIRKCMWI